MAWTKAEIVKRMSNMRAQAVMKTPVRREATLVIRLKGGEYSSTDEPLNKCVRYNIDQQLVSSNTFARFFHDSMVIGLQRKYKAKRTNSRVLKVEKAVRFHLP